MIRKAVLNDIALIEDTYDEHFQYEIDHEAFTVFRKGVYPTRRDAQQAVKSGTMFVYEKNGFEIVASGTKKVGDVILHKNHLYLEKIL